MNDRVRVSLAAAIAVVIGLLIVSVAQANRSSPTCSYPDYPPNDKYECGSVDWWYPGDWSKRIDALYYNGSLGNGGYRTYWRLYYIDIWDQFPSPGNYRRAGYFGSGPTHSNQVFQVNPYMISTNVQVWIDPVVYWCTELHSDGYYDALGNYIPPVTNRDRSEYHIDSLWYRDYTGSC